MAQPTPPIDERDAAAILKEAHALAPFYTPEWLAAEDAGAGGALLKIFARMMEGLIVRLNEVPRNNFIAFLEMLGVKLLPAQPARVPLTFTLSTGAQEATEIPRRSQAAATPPEGGDPILFETEKAILATPAQLQAVFSVVPDADQIFDHSSDLLAGTTAELFTDNGKNLQEHSLYCAHSEILDLNAAASITVQLAINGAELKATDFTHKLSWEWWNQDHWVPSTVPGFKEAAKDFPPLTSLKAGISPSDSEIVVTSEIGGDARFSETGLLLIDDEIIEYASKAGNRFTSINRGYGSGKAIAGASGPAEHVEGTEVRAIDYPLIATVQAISDLGTGYKRVDILLDKEAGIKFTQHKVNALESFWIRCRTLKNPVLQKNPPLPGLRIDTIQIGASAQEIEADALFYNDIPLDIAKPQPPVYPFGTRPRTSDTLYLASSDALSKRGGQVQLKFDITPGGEPIPVEEVEGIGAVFAERLRGQRITTAYQLLCQSKARLADILQTDQARALSILTAAQRRIRADTGSLVPHPDIPGPTPTPDIPSPTPTEELMLSWEYWDGNGWKVIRQLTDGTNKLRQSGCVTFRCPDNISIISVNGEAGFWIRVRIASGDYGRERFTFDDGAKEIETDLSQIRPPIITGLRIQYDPVLKDLQHCLALNNLEFVDVTQAARTASSPFQPFAPQEDEQQALHLGFDPAPIKGPVSIFFSLREQAYTEKNRPRLEWQYFRRRDGQKPGEWARLEIEDETKNLTQSATVQFIGPRDFAQVSRFGQRLFWIRAVDVDNKFQPTSPAPGPEPATFWSRFSGSRADEDTAAAPKVKGIHLNTAWAIQAETITDEILGSGTGEANQAFTLAKLPVIEEEIWVDELGALSEAERKALMEGSDVDVELRQDEEGNTLAFWVRWYPIEDLTEAQGTDRVYAIDHTFGQILFGDGVHGMSLPIGRNNVRATYRAGGGAKGNVGAGLITALRTTIPRVDGVTNPEPAGGGSDTESVERALERGPQTIKNRGRAVTLEDFEWITREASRSIVRVKVLPNFNDAGEIKTNWVTVIIVPNSAEPRPMPSPQLRQRVQDYLQERAANVVVFPGNIQVAGPTYVEVKVEAEIFPISIDRAPQVEAEAFRQLGQLLHPLTGGFDGQGWEFGRLPCFSDFYALLEAIKGVDHVGKLSMTLQVVDPTGAPIGEPEIYEKPPLAASAPEYALIFSGDHKIAVKPPE